MKKNKLVRIINTFLVTLLLFSAIPTSVFAEEDSATSDANKMSRSMLSFFREDRTTLQTERVARDELLVYGVFMSNFFVPWSTTLKDMVDDKSKDSIPSKMSKKFFGSPDKTADMTALNKKLYDPITQVLSFDAKTFTLYADKEATKPMTGELFYQKMAGKDSADKAGDKNNIYDSNGEILIDLGSNATQASLQVLFGFSPDYMLSSDKGLRALTGLYMDGLGNVWGSYDKSAVQDYVLFIPSAMNPRVFPKGEDGKFKFPMSNVFAMGGVIKIQENFLSKADYRTPYYNIKSSMMNQKYDKDNVVSIYGVQSATGFVGNSDSIIKNGIDENPIKKVKEFLEQDASSTMSKSSGNIIVSVDAGKVGKSTDAISKNKKLTDKEKEKLVGYLFETNVFTLDQIADDMYYFTVPKATAENASGGEGSFGEVADLIKKQKLFAKELENKDSFGFYSNSYLASPFNVFLDGYHQATDKDGYLAKHLKSGSKVDTKSAEYKALKSFLQEGTFGTKNSGSVSKALKLMENKTDFAYNVVTPAYTEKVAEDNWILSTFRGAYISTSFALTKNDKGLVETSLAARNSGMFDQMFSNYNDFVSVPPFIGSASGGAISPKGKEFTDPEIRAISNYFHNAFTYRVFSMNSTFVSQLTGTPAKGGKYSTPFSKDPLVNKTAIMNDINNYVGIYWGYMVSLLNVRPNAEGDGWEEITPYENKYLPPMEFGDSGGLDLNEVFGEQGVVASDENTLEAMQKDIINKVYGILSEGPNSTRDKLIKSAQDSWVLSTHRSITGSWVGNELSVSSGGGGSYASVVGYINTPSLHDLPLTEWVLQDYVFIYMLVLLLVMIVLILMVMTSMRTAREGVLIFILMAFVMILPQFLVTNVINLSNTAGDKMYSERFNYWAITQHQQSVKTGKNAMVTGDEMDYIIFQNMDAAKNINSSDVGVRLKWMSPKKDDVFESLFNKNTTSQSLAANLTIFRWLFSNTLNQEEYVYGDPLATYLYRPYNAIASEAKASYLANKDSTVKLSDVASKINAVKKNRLGIPKDRYNMFNKPAGSIQYTDAKKSLIKSAGGYLETPSEAENLLSYRYWALNNEEVTKGIFRSDYKADAGITGNLESPAYSAFTLTTESPFYYFYNVLHHRYGNKDGEFKQSLLSKEVFKVNSSDIKINNATRDFLDMEGLFTYVIPYLNQSNEYVYGWTDIHGKTIDGYDFANGVIPDAIENKALHDKYLAEQTKKAELAKVWKLYTPWVDQIYSQGVLNKKVRIADQMEYVEDTMNPSSYDVMGRAMIFSEADMYAKSYRYSDLSDVEQRIQATLDTTYTDLMYLTNYYDFEDDVLITAAAMMATFNFNKEFSDNKLIGESSVLYPQSFELKNFNYDAFMRLMLLNSTGEPLNADKDLYTRILDKTSIFTGILLIICDILAVMVIPTLKVAVLLLLLFLSIAIGISSVLTPPEKIVSTIFKTLGLPSLLFLVASISFAFIISLFMGEGLTDYVGSRAPEVGISDPTVTMGLMILADCVYIFVLWKIVQMLIEGLKNHSVSSFFSTVSLIAGASTAAVSGVLDKAKGVAGSVSRRGHRKELINAINGSKGGGSGGSGGSRGNFGDAEDEGAPRNTIPSNNLVDIRGGDPKDKEFKDFIDKKASPKEGAEANRSKSVGHKLVDFKQNVSNKTLNTVDYARDSVRDSVQDARDSAKYTVSKDGFRKDVKDSVKDVKVKTKNYVNDVSSYNQQRTDADRMARQQQRIDSRKRREAILQSRNNPRTDN